MHALNVQAIEQGLAIVIFAGQSMLCACDILCCSIIINDFYLLGSRYLRILLALSLCASIGKKHLLKVRTLPKLYYK